MSFTVPEEGQLAPESPPTSVKEAELTSMARLTALSDAASSFIGNGATLIRCGESKEFADSGHSRDRKGPQRGPFRSNGRCSAMAWGTGAFETGGC
jgi:hypothetical protein